MKQLNIENYEVLKDYEDILTFKELQEVLKIGRSKTYQLLQSGTIKSIRIGTEYRIPKPYVINYLYQNSTE